MFRAPGRDAVHGCQQAHRLLDLGQPGSACSQRSASAALLHAAGGRAPGSDDLARLRSFADSAGAGQAASGSQLVSLGLERGAMLEGVSGRRGHCSFEATGSRRGGAECHGGASHARSRACRSKASLHSVALGGPPHLASQGWSKRRSSGRCSRQSTEGSRIRRRCNCRGRRQHHLGNCSQARSGGGRLYQPHCALECGLRSLRRPLPAVCPCGL
mmetsp:Transcript_58101/g.130949  ORF Transcript_58101/g.130949 Transcript_58101/m.130949 type:complete len:215 (-) Transcript_58101:8-652(-)